MITTIVPKHPTPDMLKEGHYHISTAFNNKVAANATTVYEAMIKVAPKDLCEGCRFKRNYATNACIECKRYTHRIDNFEEE